MLTSAVYQYHMILLHPETKRKDQTHFATPSPPLPQCSLGHLVATSLVMASLLCVSLLKSRIFELDMKFCHQYVHRSSLCVAGYLAQFLSLLVFCFVFIASGP